MNNKFHNIVKTSTILYLSLPIFLFLIGWLNPTFSILASCALIIGCVLFIRNKEETQHIELKWYSVVFGLLLVFLWVYLSGTGGFAYQNSDYSKHNAILRDLIHYEWPVIYNYSTDYSNSAPLVYYVAYYLPAALAGKLFGWTIANVTMYLWTVLGVILSLYWLFRIIGKFKLSFILVFILFSGMDILGGILIDKSLPNLSDHLEWWAKVLQQYPSFTTLLFWVPQHAISGWLFTSLLVYNSWVSKESKFNVFIVALSSLWSPFVMIGLLPLLFLSFFSVKSYKALFSVSNILSASVLLFFIGFYYLAGSGAVSSNTGWIWNHIDFLEVWPNLALLYVLEFGLLFILLYRKSLEHKIWLFVAVFYMSIVPIYIVGGNNDFGTRSIIPSLLVLFIFLISSLKQASSKVRSSLLVLLLIIGTVTPIMEISRTLTKHNQSSDGWFTIFNTPEDYRNQYIGKPTSFFLNYLAKDDSNRAVNPVEFTLEMGNWSPYGMNATFDVNNFEVIAEDKVDAGLLLSKHFEKGTYLLKAVISGKAENVHISQYGIHKIIDIPLLNGEMEVFGLLRVNDFSEGTLVFGLGGWGTGIGETKLEELIVYKWN
ncbi:hypothetical protein MKZ15_20775 [Paenibacillus sp. FSL R7-0216]|uniref:hypothetical protein n=1 Tax=Paenibacillus sp. FSL R7-0216 TaxID=2921677 RepID=UPI0030DADDA7